MTKKNIIMLVSIILTLCLATGIAVTASADRADGDEAMAQSIQVPVQKDKVYYAYCNQSSGKGAVAFCLDNSFTDYGRNEAELQLCTLGADGAYTCVYSVPKDRTGVCFAGKHEYTLEAGADLSELLGGLGSVGFTFGTEKTNVILALDGFALTPGGEYYIYIPQDYFADGEGNGNMGAYIPVESTKVSAYSGNPVEDAALAAEKVYDAALFGLESLAGILS